MDDIWTPQIGSTVDVLELFTCYIRQFNVCQANTSPIVYTFSKRPILHESVDYFEIHDDIVQSLFYKEWHFWLNQGSSIRVTYNVKDFGQDYLLLAFIQGSKGLNDWIKTPESPAKALKWYQIHGIGFKDFVINWDDEYFVAFGNRFRGNIEIIANLSIHSILYSIKSADKSTTFTPTVEAITLPIKFFHTKYLLLTTPSEPQEDANVWKIAITYSVRWITCIILWGIVVFALVVFYGLEFGRRRIWQNNQEELPLLTPQDDHVMSSRTTNNFLSVGVSTLPGDLASYGESFCEDQQLCTICLAVPKDCFFDPCGHRCTCYNCGERIQTGNTANCPICRQPIKAVRKIFDS